MRERVYMCTMECVWVLGELAGLSSFPPPCGSWNGIQVVGLGWQQIPLPAGHLGG